MNFDTLAIHIIQGHMTFPSALVLIVLILAGAWVAVTVFKGWFS